MKQIEKKVLKKISPTDKYRKEIKNILKKIRLELDKEIKKRKLPAEIKLVGSIAKDTYLMNNMDIDFFLCYPTNLTKEKISKETLSIGKSILKNTEESYAEHPYIRGYYKDFYVEIVPCYKIEKADQKLSAVDRTPLHTKYVKENLKEQQKREVRLLKQFLKGINCYGAEAQIQGFSGYLCEILIIYYEDFKNLIKNASDWQKGIKLSLSKGEKNPNFETPLIFIDPVDPERNVASAVIYEKFKLFKKASIEYLKNPNINFFFPNQIKPWPLEKIKKEIKKQDCKYLGIKFNEPDIIDENLYPQIRKAENSIVESCKRNEFNIYDSKFYINSDKNDIYIILKTEKKNLQKTKIHQGPPLKMEKNVKEFKEKWQNHKRLIQFITSKDKRINAEIIRKHTNIKRFLEKNILDLSLGKHLDKVVKKSYAILNEKDLIKKELRVFWTEYLDKKFTWER